MRIHHKIACFDYDCLALSLLSTRKLKAARFLVSSRLKGSISRAACRLVDCALPFDFSIFILRRYCFVVNLTNCHHNFPAKKFWPAHGSDNCWSQRLRPFSEKPSAKCSLKKSKNEQCSALHFTIQMHWKNTCLPIYNKCAAFYISHQLFTKQCLDLLVLKRPAKQTSMLILHRLRVLNFL